MITALAGGVRVTRFLTGVVKLVNEKDLSIIVHTGDDIELFGLHISPDIDIVAYTLAGIVDEEKGWGIRGGIFHCLEPLRKFNREILFNLGDKDIATHIFRTNLLKNGLRLSEVTTQISHALGLNVTQEYLVKRGAKRRSVRH